MDLFRPWGHAVRIMLVLLRTIFLVGFFQLLVLPVRLRGLSLKRRFTVTLAMYRFIPGTLAFILMILIVYLGIGLHRASIAGSTFDNTLKESMRTAEMVLAARTGPGGIGPAGAKLSIPSSELCPMDPADRFHVVVQRLEWTELQTDSSGGNGDEKGWVPLSQTASPATPQAILGRNFFAEAPSDSSEGLVVQNGALFLRSARMHREGDEAVGAEVFVVLDSLYLARIAEQVQSDIRVIVSSNVRIGGGAVNIETEERHKWTDSTFAVSAPFIRDTSHDDFWEHRFYLARTFIPVGNWLESLGDDNWVGAVQLQLYTTPRGLYESLTNSTLTLASQAFAIFIFAGIGLLFLIVELSAVRTGRSIIKGILADVKSLSDAAKRFGQGDLHHRVTLAGKDEMGRLAAAFNTMAADIEENQQALIEKERLEADLAVARDIQQRMLPQNPPNIPGLDVAGISIPSREVGGDLFYFLPVAGGRLGITIGDVSGKSVPAAILMSNVLAALKSEARIVSRENEILNHINQVIFDQVEPGRFVTFFYGVVDPEQRILRYACAGHNPPLIMRRSGEAKWLQDAGLPLGIMPDNTYESVETTIEEGDVLVLYSDGVTEAQRTPGDTEEKEPEEHAEGNEFFDEQRLEAAVRAARGESSSGIISHVMDAIHEFTGGAEQSDDLTLVIVRMTR